MKFVTITISTAELSGNGKQRYTLWKAERPEGLVPPSMSKAELSLAIDRLISELE